MLQYATMICEQVPDFIFYRAYVESDEDEEVGFSALTLLLAKKHRLPKPKVEQLLRELNPLVGLHSDSNPFDVSLFADDEKQLVARCTRHEVLVN